MMTTKFYNPTWLWDALVAAVIDASFGWPPGMRRRLQLYQYGWF